MYIWGIFLMLGCLAKSSQACSYLSHNSWSEHVKQKFSDGFSGCQDYEFTGINILTLVQDLVATIDEIAIAELSVDYIEEGTWVLKALLSVHLGCKGFSGSVLEVKVNGKLRLSIDNECGCPQYEILAGSLELFVSVLNAPLVDLKLLGFLGILTGSLKTQLSDGFIGSLTVLLKETITTTCHSVVEKINFEFQSITEEFLYGGDSCSYEATSLDYTDDGFFTSWSFVNLATGSVTSLTEGLPLGIIFGLTAGLSSRFIFSEKFLTSISTSKSLSEISCLVEDFKEWEIFNAITGDVTCFLDEVISEVCEVTADGTVLTSVLSLSFNSAAKKAFLKLKVTVSRSIDIVTGGSQISFLYGVLKIIETHVTSGGESCGCPVDSILEKVFGIVGKVALLFDNDSKYKGEQNHLSIPQPKWVNGDSSASHSCSSYDNCVSC